MALLKSLFIVAGMIAVGVMVWRLLQRQEAAHQDSSDD